jgi:hypothetical protein
MEQYVHAMYNVSRYIKILTVVPHTIFKVSQCITTHTMHMQIHMVSKQRYCDFSDILYKKT